MSQHQAAERAVVEMRKLADYIEIPHRLSVINMDRGLDRVLC